MGSVFLCNKVGVASELQHASYIEHWLAALKSDKRLIFTAASAAQRAVDFLIPKPVAGEQKAVAEVVRVTSTTGAGA